MSSLRLFVWLFVPLLACAQHATNAPSFAAATAEAKRLQLAPGLKLDVWAAEPLLSNGVAFSFDGRGRCYVAESHRWAVSIFDITQHTNWLTQDMSFRSVADRLAFLSNQFATNITFLTKDSELVRRVEDRAGTGRADHSEVVAGGFNSVVDGTAAGVLATGPNVYFADIPSLWRISTDELRMTNGGAANVSIRTSRLAPRTPLASGFGVHIGVSGHDLHGLIKGPDGRIYMSFGDRGVCLTNREGVVINLPDTGGVLRCEPDGRDLEVFCFGLRNPQELAFDDLGNLWTVDNDTAGADPCRVLHLVEGGDYGWRTSYQHMEGFGPWVQEELWKGGQDGILPPAGTVSQGPSGLAFYPGTGFGDRLRGKFLHCDFPAGVVAFSVKPRGASYELDTQEKFLWNCWPTDVDFGPDGAAYVLDWVNGWGQPGKGRIYRITPNSELGTRNSELVAETQRLLAEGMTQRGEKELLNLLGHADRRVRLEAQWELAGRGTNSFKGLLSVAKNSKSQFARIHALWGIGQLSRQVRYGFVFSAELAQLLPLLSDNDAEMRFQTCAILVGEGRLSNADHPTAKLFADPNPRVRLAAAQAFTRSFSSGKMRLFIPPIERLKEELASKADRLIGTKSQIDLAVLWTEREGPYQPWKELAGMVRTDAGTNEFLTASASRLIADFANCLEIDECAENIFSSDSSFVRRAGLLALRRLTNSALTNFLADPDPRLVIAAGRAIHDVPIVEGFPALAQFILRVDCPTNLMSRAVDAAFRLGTPQHAQMLAGFAKRRDVPAWARALALSALADWGHPPQLDRVVGLWRPAYGGVSGVPFSVSSNTAAPASVPAENLKLKTESSSNPLLARAASGVSNSQSPISNLPALPADLGRSFSFEEGMAVKRNDVPAKRAFLRVAGEIMDPATPDAQGLVLGGPPAPVAVQLAVIATAVKLRTKEASTPLFDLFTRSNTAPEVRRTLVSALANLHAAQAGDAVKLALADSDPQLRAAALPYLDRLEGEDAVGLLSALVPGGRGSTRAEPLPTPADLRLAQAAVAALGNLPGAPADAALRELAAALAAGRLPPELALDVREALRARDQNGTAAPPRSDTLIGGDAERGREIFFGNPTVQCSRCHSVGGNGGTVGPKLDGVGGRNPRPYLLESIVAPNARIAPGFENAVVTLTDGRTLAGTVKRDTDDVLLLELVDGEAGTTNSVSLAKSDIRRRERGPSAMPEGLAAQLTPFELRDLVEYLASLK